MDGQISGLGTVHPLPTLNFLSTWILPLHVPLSTLKTKSSSSVMDGPQGREEAYQKVFHLNMHDFSMIHTHESYVYISHKIIPTNFLADSHLTYAMQKLECAILRFSNNNNNNGYF